MKKKKTLFPLTCVLFARDPIPNSIDLLYNWIAQIETDILSVVVRVWADQAGGGRPYVLR